jgi:cytochrome c5
MYNKILIIAITSFVMTGCTTSNELSKVETKSNTTVEKTAVNGEAVHKASCTKCHSSTVYTRPNRTVKSLDSLQQRVAKCNVNVGTNLTDDEVASVSNHLNTTYYKFKK